MAKALNIPVSDLCYENGVLYELAKKLQLPTSSADFNYHELMKATNYGIKDMRKRMYEFAALRCPDRNGITKESLLKQLFIPESKIGNEFAQSLNLTESSVLSFCQYARLFSTVVDPEMANYSFENIFQCLNLSCNAYLVRDDFKRVFDEIFYDVSSDNREEYEKQCWKSLIS